MANSWRKVLSSCALPTRQARQFIRRRQPLGQRVVLRQHLLIDVRHQLQQRAILRHFLLIHRGHRLRKTFTENIRADKLFHSLAFFALT